MPPFLVCSPPLFLLLPGLFVPMHRVSKAMHQAAGDRRRKAAAKRDPLLVASQAIEAQSQVQMNTELQVRGTCHIM